MATKPFGLFRWTDRAIRGLFDQAMFSGSMFALNILLARWTGPDEYGSFAVLFAIFLILAGIHNALIIEPMTIYGSRKSGTELSVYLAHVYVLHLVVVCAIAAVAIVIAAMISDPDLSRAKWALPFTIPLALSYWVVRRSCYVTERSGGALALSSLYAFFVISGTIALKWTDLLSSYTALLLFGVSGFMVSIFPMLRALLEGGWRIASAATKSARQHWRYGRWAIAESLTFALGTGIFPLLIAYFGTVSQAGEVRALQLIFLPLTHFLIGAGLLALPWLARSRVTVDAIEFSRRSRLLIAIFGAAAICYVVPVLGWRHFAVQFLYDNDNYQAGIWMMPYLGFVAILTAMAAALMIILRALERPDLVFWSTAATFAVTLAVGTWLISGFGLTGLVLALVLNGSASLIALACLARSTLRPVPVAAKTEVLGERANA